MKVNTQFLLEIAAGAGETLGGTFEQLAELDGTVNQI